MTDTTTQQHISFTLNGRSVTADLHEPLLSVTRRFGLDIPTLCHHDALPPGDACRLCLVEVEKNGRRKFVTACNYPVQADIAVTTASAVLDTHRKTIISLLLARCAEVPVLQRLANQLGVTTPTFKSDSETCILCGLCTRVCQSYATSAITVLNRGTDRRIGTVGQQPPPDCVGCGACAQICPTGHIDAQRTAGQYHIWDTSFPLATCSVDADACSGCGSCEEWCPFSIPRIQLRRDGVATAHISPEACRGCGVCYAACPFDAIKQPRFDRELPDGTQPASLLVYGCDRCNLGRPASPPLPLGVQFVQIPCAGGVTPTMLLNGLTAGFAGVLVLGRHQHTCRLDGAEHFSQSTVSQIDHLAELAGWGRHRVAFREPGPGADGALKTIATHLATLPSPPIDVVPTARPAVSGYHGVRQLLSGGSPEGARWLAQNNLPTATDDQPPLLAGDLPYFDLLLRAQLGTVELASVLRDALRLLAEAGIDTGVAMDPGGRGAGCTPTGQKNSTFYTLDVVSSSPTAETISILDLLCERGVAITAPTPAQTVAVSRHDPALRQTLETLGWSVRPIDVPQDDVVVESTSWQTYRNALAAAQNDPISILVVSSVAQLIPLLLAQRQGAWQHAKITPMLPTTLLAAQL